jgi:hypothetical protein
MITKNKKESKFNRSFFKWFFEIFTKEYYHKHKISSIIFYTIIVMIFYSFVVNLIPFFNIINLCVFLLKIIFVFYIMVNIKFIAEKLNLEQNIIK